MDYWFVDEKFCILKGEESKQALKETSDAKFLSADRGITRVSRSRWEIAQIFECSGWMEKWAGASDDRNLQHMADFDGYRTLRDMSFKHAIELGCGPFTNLRLIGQVCNVTRCTLLDPLIDSYLQHQHCRYDRQTLHCGENALSRFLSRPRMLRGVRRVINRIAPDLLVAKAIPIHELIAYPIEIMPIHQLYDLIVIINVIEHCYDADLVFQNIAKIAAPHAILVFHDKYYEHEVVSQMVDGHYYEAGHPLMVDKAVFDEFLSSHCIPLYRQIIQKNIPQFDVMPTYNGIFFIGRFRNS